MESAMSVAGGVDFRIDKRDSQLQQSNQQCFWSPDGSMVAAAKANKVKVWALQDPRTGKETLTVIASYSLKDAISMIEWSPDNKYILCAMFKHQAVQVVPVDMSDDWTCSMCEGVVAGLVHARWAPDARHILTTAEFNLHITIWSLTSKTVYYIDSPKDPVHGVSFTHDGKYVAVARRKSCKDYVAIYHCGTWELVKEFPVDTQDLVELQWSPDDSAIAIRDSVMQYGILVYSADGRKQKQYQAYKHCLGAKTMAFSPSSQFLAVGSFDEQVRVLNHLTWAVIATYRPPRRVDGAVTNVFVEESDAVEDMDTLSSELAESKRKAESDIFASFKGGRRRGARRGDAASRAGGRRAGGRAGGRAGARASGGAGAGAGAGATGAKGDGPGHTVDAPSRYVLHEGVLDIKCVDPPPKSAKSPPRIGVGICEWSPDSKYLAVRNDNMQTTVWVYETVSMEVKAVLVHANAVRAFKWSSKGTRLAIVTGNSKVYFWEESGATCLAVQDGFTALRLKWNPSGEKLIVLSRTSWTCGYLES